MPDRLPTSDEEQIIEIRNEFSKAFYQHMVQSRFSIDTLRHVFLIKAFSLWKQEVGETDFFALIGLLHRQFDARMLDYQPMYPGRRQPSYRLREFVTFGSENWYHVTALEQMLNQMISEQVQSKVQSVLIRHAYVWFVADVMAELLSFHEMRYRVDFWPYLGEMMNDLYQVEIAREEKASPEEPHV